MEGGEPGINSRDIAVRCLALATKSPKTSLCIYQLSLTGRSINIGYTMNPRGLWDLEPRGNLYKHPHAKRKGVYGFQGDLNPVGPEGSLYKVFQSNHFSPWQQNCVRFTP